MRQLGMITVGIDLSDNSQCALAQAARLATAAESSLQVVHVVEELVVADLAQSLGQPVTEVRADVIRDADEALRRRCAELAMPRGWRAEVRIGRPWRDLLAAAEESASRLVVLGLRGAGGGRRGVGTVAGQCVRRALRPTLLVAPSWQGAAQLVVVGVDFSRGSLSALSEALELARRDGARMEAVHVFAAPWHRLHYRAPTPQAAPTYQRAYRRALQARLERFVAESAQANEVSTTCLLVDAASDGRGLAAHADRRGADLLVVGTHGRSDLRERLLGTTAERLLAETRVSLLAVPATAAD